MGWSNVFNFHLMILWFSMLELFFVKKKSKFNTRGNSLPTSSHLFFVSFLTCYKEETLMSKLWGYSQTTYFPLMLLLFVLFSIYRYRKLPCPLICQHADWSLKTSFWTLSETPRILSCHRFPSCKALLSFLLRALVTSGHALEGQTCQDLAIKHSFHQRKPGRFPKLTDRFFWTLYSTPPTGHFFEPVGSFCCFF